MPDMKNIEKTDDTNRINKYLSHNTRYSRREADELIKAGRVKVGQKTVTDLSTQVNPDDKVYLDGKAVRIQNEYTVIVYNKPKGELVTRKDNRGRKTVYETLPGRFSHFISVGRLDYASEGLMLLTDSPKIATALMESNLERIYKLKIEGFLTPAMEKAMQEGLELKDARAGGHQKSAVSRMEFAPFYAYEIQKNAPNYSRIKVAIGEGKNRELRRFFAHFGAKVLDLKRLSYGGVDLNNLPTGKFRFLEKQEYASLRTFLKEVESKSD